ncbi:MAG: metal ABC transporter ATP-binding protein [Candidatus Scalindua sp. AMX11]|nr:metal ABC transporter ATP-binding protein [Planctomycetota bacterium]RZV67440.1 MAG: metal ABC transporter ATP-binding protein [Candidatus Scalindua sp. SCAELEC01]TDE63678.1 MAG: metal ABC transporter ATP-binding protein [Candidatus Scalindua sp. AMX11]GJQ60563.1 MAG: zinc ABC transporter ATP-binding protein [Candidatus Scalindua sp.]
MKTTNQPIISFNGVSLGYGKKIVLNDLNFDILSNDFLGIIGPNGAGKTTLLKGILGLLKPTSGTITARDPHIKFGYVVQRQFVDQVFPLTAREIVSMGRYRHIKLGRGLRKGDWDHVNHALEIAGVSSVACQTYRSLSGGQKQRVLIARALASEANILILDEPTNDMDIKGETQIMELIKNIHAKQRVTVVIVSHLLHNIINYVQRLACVTRDTFLVQSIEEATTGHYLSEVFDSPIKVGEITGKKVVISNGSTD